MHHAASIFLTLLVFLVGGNFAIACNQESSAAPGDLCAFAVQPSSTDILGRRTTATVKNKLGSVLSSETYGYDIRSQLTGYTGYTGYTGPNGSIGYGYDLAGNLAGAKSATVGGYDVSYDYDSQNRLVMVHRGQEGIDPNATELAAYNYDQNGNLNGVGYANGVQHAYSYNALNRLTALNVSSISPSTIPNPRSLQGYAYTLNKNGHRTQIRELSGRTINNTFDALHRLTREAITLQSGLDILSQPSPSTGTLSYSYDPVGNRTARTTTGTVSQIIPSQSHTFTPNDRLTSDTYDANGNTTSSEGGSGVSPVSSSDTYSFDNKLIRRTTPDGKTIDLTYNPDGHRLAKLIAQGGLTQRLHHYLTDANNPTGYAQVIEEKDPFDTASPLRKTNLYGHDLVSSSVYQPSTLNHQLLYYSYDGLGSVRGITGETGELLETYDYDAYGTLIGLAKRSATSGELESQNIHDPQSTISHPSSDFLFTGEQWDADLGMYFLRARYLNTNTGRFHSQDTYEGRNGEPLTLHKYLYAHGNPVMFTDPSGYLTATETSFTTGQILALSGLTFLALDSAQQFKISILAIENLRLLIAAGGEVLWRAVGSVVSNWQTKVLPAIKAAIQAGASYLKKNIEYWVKRTFFVVKSVMPTIYAFNQSALAANPSWHLLNYNGPYSPITSTNRAYIKATYGSLRLSAPVGYQLDEFPFASTAQGGFGALGMMVPTIENAKQGGFLGAFYRYSGLRGAPGPFLVVPLNI